MMHSIWLCFLKKNLSRSGKLTDVHEFISRNTNNSKTRHISGQYVVQAQQDDIINKHYSELRPGDSSRKIIEMIVGAAMINPDKQTYSSRIIKTVLRVQNSIETLNRFENYREMIKKKAYQQPTVHPRSAVDGNEMLRFYRTTFTCIQGGTVSQLCQDPRCGVCAMIKSPSLLEDKATTQLSCSSNLSCDRRTGKLKRKNVKTAVIVCRIIAGKVDNGTGVREDVEKCDLFLGQTRNSTEVLID